MTRISQGKLSYAAETNSPPEQKLKKGVFLLLLQMHPLGHWVQQFPHPGARAEGSLTLTLARLQRAEKGVHSKACAHP